MLAQAFHIASGLNDHIKWRMRKAVRRWVGRANIRKSLRRQIFQTALKGNALRLLLTMMDDADTDDLSNAILARDGEGCTPLLLAAKRGFTDVTEALISSGARCADELGDESLLAEIVDTQDADGNSALHWAARKGHSDVAAALLEAGALVNARNAEEATPLHWAARKNQAELLNQLLEAGALTGLVNKWGATPLDQAKSFTQAVAVEILQAAEKGLKQSGARQAALAAQDAAAQGTKTPSPPSKQGKASGGSGGKGGGKKKAWGEGPGSSEKNPVALRQQQAKRRADAEVRRQAALKKVEELDAIAAKDQELRRKRQTLELKLKELIDSVQGAVGLAPATRAQGGHQGAKGGGGKVRDRSPPKTKIVKGLEETIAAAKEVECVPGLIELAEAHLREARSQVKLAKELEKSQQQQQSRGKSPGQDKDALDKQMRKLQKKMGR